MYTYSCLRLRLFTLGDPSSAARVSLAMICLTRKAMSKPETSARGHIAKRQRQENPTSLTRSKHPMRPKSSSGNSLHRTAKAFPKLTVGPLKDKGPLNGGHLFPEKESSNGYIGLRYQEVLNHGVH